MKLKSILTACAILMSVSAFAQTAKTIDMEDVTRIGSKCEYDDETCTATFTGQWDRWVDLPGVKGDISATPNISVEVLKSNIILKFCVRYTNNEGKTEQVDVATVYGQMGKAITSKKVVKLNLLEASKGKLTEDMLKNVVSLRLAVGKTIGDEPWEIQFGEVKLY
jgi:hypothetical protein